MWLSEQGKGGFVEEGFKTGECVAINRKVTV